MQQKLSNAVQAQVWTAFLPEELLGCTTRRSVPQRWRIAVKRRNRLPVS